MNSNNINKMKTHISVLVMLIILALNTGCHLISQQIPLPNPEPDFYFVSDTSYIAPCEVYFKNQSYYATLFDWDFEDGRIYNELNKTYYFKDAGTYNITLKASNVDGASQTITKSIEIKASDEIPTKHKYDGKWRVVESSVNEPTLKGVGIKDSVLEYLMQASPDLSFFKPDSWRSPIIVRNTLFTDLNNMSPISVKTGDVAIIALAFANKGEVNVNSKFRIAISIDGEFHKEWDFQPPLNAGDWYFNYDIYLGRLTTGKHTVTFTLDALDEIAEADENNNSFTQSFFVSDKLTFESFEFSNNRYIMLLNNMVYQYGKLHYSDNFIHLESMGNCKVVEFIDDEMQIEIDGMVYKLVRENPIIPITDATLKLTNGYWLHTQAVDTLLPNDEWTFTTSGTFVSKVSGNTSFLNYYYVNDSVIQLQNNQTINMKLQELTLTRMVLKDDLQQIYRLNTQLYK